MQFNEGMIRHIKKDIQQQEIKKKVLAENNVSYGPKKKYYVNIPNTPTNYKFDELQKRNEKYDLTTRPFGAIPKLVKDQTVEEIDPASQIISLLQQISG